MKSNKWLSRMTFFALMAIMGTQSAFAGTSEMLGIACPGPTETPGFVAVFLDYLALMI